MQKSARPRINRRQFPASAALTSAGLASVSPRAVTRPNILVITTDQQWGGALSCAGNPHVHTPAMDSLAANGVRFDAAYTANPICVPSSTSYITGTPSHVNGVVTNMRANQVPVDVPCLSKHFRDQGYDTGYVGKWHIPRALEDRDWSGFDYIESARNNGVDTNFPGHCRDFILKSREKPFFLIASFVNPHDVCEIRRLRLDQQQGLLNNAVDLF